MRKLHTSPLKASGFAALVDILLATMGIFIVVLSQIQIEDSPQLVPVVADGLLVCETAEIMTGFVAQDGQETSESFHPSKAKDFIHASWQNTGRAIVVILPDCAFTKTAHEIWKLETSIRKINEEGTAYLLDIMPATKDNVGIGSLGHILSTWRLTHGIEKV